MGFSILRKSKIKIGFLIAYDYRYIYDALKIVYNYADEIILAIDENRNTWAGGKFDIEDRFFEAIKSIDVNNKITFFEADFYHPELKPMENETRERNMISALMGNDCWKLQIDADEYFLNFDKVYEFLQKHRYFLSKPKYNPVNIRGNWITLFKKTENGFIYIDNEEHFSFATNLVGAHFFGRDLPSVTNREIYTNFRVLHQSWAREPEEIHRKINNWGHKDDFDGEAFFDFWMNVSEQNYDQFTDLHPIYKGAWKGLKFIACTDIHDFIEKFNQVHPPLETTQLPGKYFKKYIKNTLKVWRK